MAKCFHCSCYYTLGNLTCCTCGKSAAAGPAPPAQAPPAAVDAWLGAYSAAGVTTWVMRYGDSFVQDPFRVDLSRMAVDPRELAHASGYVFGV